MKVLDRYKEKAKELVGEGGLLDHRDTLVAEAIQKAVDEAVDERDAEWSEAMDPTCLAEFTPGIASMFRQSLEDALAECRKDKTNEREMALEEAANAIDTLANAESSEQAAERIRALKGNHD